MSGKGLFAFLAMSIRSSTYAILFPMPTFTNARLPVGFGISLRFGWLFGRDIAALRATIKRSAVPSMSAR
ncbi:MAG: hypothetical protein IPL32_20045 [Chloracidobacterium sp.]|nr:hypothetical protein [Chloracidobacterium sp.]